MCNRPFLRAKKVQFRNRTFALFESAIVQLLFLKCEKSAILKFALFSYIFAFAYFERVIVRLHFFKEQQKVRSHIHTFLKSNKKCDRTFAHF